MKLNISSILAAFIVIGWDFIHGAYRGPLLGKRGLGIAVPQQRSNVVSSPLWKVVYGLDEERRTGPGDYRKRVLSRQGTGKIPSEDYPDYPGYYVIKKDDAWPLDAELIEELEEERNDFPLYDTRLDDLVHENPRRKSERERNYYKYY